MLEMVKAFEAASGRAIPYQIKPAALATSPSAGPSPPWPVTSWGWQAEQGLEQMMIDTWRWQSQNPDGYQA